MPCPLVGRALGVKKPGNVDTVTRNVTASAISAHGRPTRGKHVSKFGTDLC